MKTDPISHFIPRRIGVELARSRASAVMGFGFTYSETSFWVRFMKAKTIAVALLVTTAVPLFGGVVFVGSVASIANGGTEAVLIVEPSRYDNTGMTLRPYTAVFVYANFRNAVDGDRFKFVGECIGKVNYTKANGAEATVLGFRGMAIPIALGQTNY
jgi:hypothetical protein